MAKSGKVTAKVAQRVAHWRRFGLGREDIASKLRAEGFDVTGRTVSRTIALAIAADGTARKTAAIKRTASPAKRGAVVAEAVTAELSHFSDDGADELAHLRLRYAEVRGLADELAPRSKEGGRNASVYCQLVRLQGDLAARVRDLTPPQRPDPAVDPANLEAKALLIGMIEGLVSNAEVQP